MGLCTALARPTSPVHSQASQSTDLALGPCAIGGGGSLALMVEPDLAEWTTIRRRQEGAVSRAQLCARGVTPAAMRANVAAGRWQRPLPGVFVTFTGPLPLLTTY
jgi:hypothetical protein